MARTKNRKTFFYIVQPRTKDARVYRVMQKRGVAHHPKYLGQAPLPNLDMQLEAVVYWLITKRHIHFGHYANGLAEVHAV